LDEFAQDYDGRVKFGKINAQANMGRSAKYGVRAAPTLILFKGGEVEDIQVGSESKAKLKAFIDSNI
jgi:thioredoxin 1